MSQDQQLNEGSIDEIPKEALVKELKIMKKKLDKLQEKYVITFKENKLLSKDREVLEKLALQMFSEDPYKLDQKALGGYEVNQLLDLLGKREEEKQKVLNNIIRDTNKEKHELEERYKTMMEKQVQGMDQKSQTLINQLKQQKNEIENNNVRLAREIIELNDIIQFKNREILKSKKIEEEYSTFKTQQMLNELESSSSRVQDLQYKIQNSDKINDQLRVNQQIDKLLEEITKLRRDSQEKDKQIHQMTQKLQQRKSINYDEIDPFGNEQKLAKPLQKSESVQTDNEIFIDIDLHGNHNNNHQGDHGENQQQEYLKNVLFKYFLYQETKNFKEANILMNAIMTILKMNKVATFLEERKLIEEARDKGTVWHSAKSMLTEGLFCMKHQNTLNDSVLQGKTSMTQMMNQGLQMNNIQ